MNSNIPKARFQTNQLYSCPMHPEIVSNEVGNCSKCGMALEARTIKAETKNAELKNMSRRFWVSS